jgi:hypothetical protein
LRLGSVARLDNTDNLIDDAVLDRCPDGWIAG